MILFFFHLVNFPLHILHNCWFSVFHVIYLNLLRTGLYHFYVTETQPVFILREVPARHRMIMKMGDRWVHLSCAICFLKWVAYKLFTLTPYLAAIRLVAMKWFIPKMPELDWFDFFAGKVCVDFCIYELMTFIDLDSLLIFCYLFDFYVWLALLTRT